MLGNSAKEKPTPWRRDWTLKATCFALVIAGCHRSPPPPEEGTNAAPPPKPAQAPPEAVPQRFEVMDTEDEAHRWLHVEAVRDGAPGGWATGSFDRARNKLDVQTRDVRQFALHLDRVPIDWNKLVVLSIDGNNSELRRRETSRIHVRLDDYGKWAVADE